MHELRCIGFVVQFSTILFKNQPNNQLVHKRCASFNPMPTFISKKFIFQIITEKRMLEMSPFFYRLSFGTPFLLINQLPKTETYSQSFTIYRPTLTESVLHYFFLFINWEMGGNRQEYFQPYIYLPVVKTEKRRQKDQERYKHLAVYA